MIFPGAIRTKMYTKMFMFILNHKGESDFSNDIFNYLKKEASYGAIIGPFKNNPFVSELKISPLNTVTKRDSPERRVILDLSFPSGKSVNDHISKEFYLGEKVELSYPNVDDLVGIIKDKGPRCMLFKKRFKKGLSTNSCLSGRYSFYWVLLGKLFIC